MAHVGIAAGQRAASQYHKLALRTILGLNTQSSLIMYVKSLHVM